MPQRKRKAPEQETRVEEPVDDIDVPALPDNIPMPSIEESQEMGTLAAAAAAAVSVSQPPPMTASEIAAAAAAAAETATASSDPAISRKEKSLAVLCLNFMEVARNKPFLPDGTKQIEIQGIAEELGAKRRRIYDIINILESIMVVSRVKKNTYKWNGMDGLPAMFAVIQKEGLEEYANKEAEAAAGGSSGAAKEDATIPDSDVADMVSDKKTKGVARTCKKFFQIFLTTGQTHVAVSDAANIIEGPLTPSNQKALTRRIYDIANVLQSCGIIEKYNVGSTSFTNKPGFRWSYQVSPEDMSKYLPEGHGEALPFNPAPWSVPIGPNPTLDDSAPEPLADPEDVSGSATEFEI